MRDSGAGLLAPQCQAVMLPDGERRERLHAPRLRAREAGRADQLPHVLLVGRREPGGLAQSGGGECGEGLRRLLPPGALDQHRAERDLEGLLAGPPPALRAVPVEQLAVQGAQVDHAR